MSSRLSTVEVLAAGFAGGQWVRVRFERYGRTLLHLGGPVATAVPLLVRYRGSKRKALRMVERLKLHGHNRVKVQRMPKEKTKP